MRLIRWSFLALLLVGGARAQTDLQNLNRAADPAAYVAERLGGAATIDNTGSLRISYGQGAPHTLLVAGLDAPGYTVSGVTDDGYLRLQRVAEPPPGYQFDSLWPGQPVDVLRWNRAPLAGVVLAPSVHFASDRSGYSGSGTLDKLYVDIGA
jgi:putative aminopeptidase FrvX